MKLCVIYDPLCPKLKSSDYSRTYLDMFEQVVKRFEKVQHITESCSAQDIDADVILVYDIHSSHHIVLDGLPDHKSVKYTYFNDPHQPAIVGIYQDGSDQFVHKLGEKKRTLRVLNRGIDYIICPYKGLYYKHIAPYLDSNADKMLFWFPPAPSIKRFKSRTRPLGQRIHKILANGITWGRPDAYEFRKWAYEQKESFFVEHAFKRPDVPKGAKYGDFLASYAASLALCDMSIVPKYLEIPLARCVCFAQHQPEYVEMGFVDGVNCILVDRLNFKGRTSEFVNSNGKNLSEYQLIADAGRKLIEEKWTAECFADALYKHAAERVSNQTRKD